MLEARGLSPTVATTVTSGFIIVAWQLLVREPGREGPEQAREFTDTTRSDPVALHSLTETRPVDSICCY